MQAIMMKAVAVNSGTASVGATKIEGAAATRWPYTASGPMTNIAARLATLAEGGTVAISQETQSRLGDEFTLEDLGLQSLKNVPKPLRAFRAIGRYGSGIPPSSDGRRTTLRSNRTSHSIAHRGGRAPVTARGPETPALAKGGTMILRAFGLLLISAPVWLGGAAFADDAAVLPKGAFRLTSDVRYYPSFDKRYDPDGKIEDIATDFNRPLDSRAFPLLSPLDRFVGGRASFGDAVVSMDVEITELELSALYGVTDRLTVGVLVPISWEKTHVKARLNSGPGSSANVGLNPRFGQPGQPPVIPISAGGIPLTTEDVQRLLGPGLPGIPGLGFKEFGSQTNEGLNDIEAGFRYQYLRTDDWRLAFTGGVRAPTGKVDDPDNLVDRPLGTGAWALLFRLNQDYAISHLWTGTRPPSSPGELLLNGTFRYDLYLPDHAVKRVPDDVNNPLTANKENVSRDLGDKFEFEVSGKYTLWKGFSLSGLYRYGFKLEDRISGTKGFRYESLEEETARTEHIYIVGLSYSTLGLYSQKRFPLPLIVSLSYRDRFAGSNNASRSQYIALGLQIFF